MCSSPQLLLRLTLSLVFSCFPVPSRASSFLRAGQVTENDATQSLEVELAGGTLPDSKKHLQWLEDKLRPTYWALPKNAAGNLGHQAVRYVLHRFFVQQRGWFIRGLEPTNDTSWRTAIKPLTVKEWVPDFLQGVLEKKAGERGTTLMELAALAAALEDLVRKEAVGRLQTAYELHALPLNGPLSEPKVEEALTTYFVAYLKAGNFSADDADELSRKKQLFAKRYAGYDEAKGWLDDVVGKRMSTSRSASLNFAAASNIASEIGEKFYAFNDLECKSLKTTLQGLEGKKAGRVRLSTFYKASLYSHWRFNERADYLKRLGALDDSDPLQPRVIVPNYIMSRPNCLEASNLYAVCCRNECEDLLSHLESQIGSSAAEPLKIAEMVANLPSDMVPAPRNLSQPLMDRLFQVARNNYGRVPLHGRLFAQWMHHAYPRECPYPHEVGTTSPHTPDEWMKETGHSMAAASTEEMMQQVASDTCASDSPQSGAGCGDEESEELPWNEAEELLLAHREEKELAKVPRKELALQATSRQDDTTAKPQTASSSSWLTRVGIVAAASIGLAAFGLAYPQRMVHRGFKDDKPIALPAHWLLVPFALVVLLVYGLGLLDGATLLFACIAGLVALIFKKFVLRHSNQCLGRSDAGKLPV